MDARGLPFFESGVRFPVYWDSEESSVKGPELVAGKIFGAEAGPVVRQAWGAFSSAFKQFPFDMFVAYNAPQNIGPANLLHDKPTDFAATMVGIPYDDLKGWRSIYPEEIFEEQFKQVADGWKRGIEISRSGAHRYVRFSVDVDGHK